jgi:hypothetical protein
MPSAQAGWRGVCVLPFGRLCRMGFLADVRYWGHQTICSKLHGKGERAENAQRVKSRLPLASILKGSFERKNRPKSMIAARQTVRRRRIARLCG